MMNDCTVVETYTLPSQGKIYGVSFDPTITLTSMTTNQEMRRLGQSDRPFKVMSEIIDECIVEKLPISCYDMCTGDYQYLLHKLRVVTYGPDYKISTTCPYCGMSQVESINLDALEFAQYDESVLQYLTFDLPTSKHRIEIGFQTPHIRDDIFTRVKEMRARNAKLQGDPSFLLTLQSLIKTVDGQVLDVIQKEEFVSKLGMRDANVILQYAQEFEKKVGLNTDLIVTCNVCGFDYHTTFRETGEFFRPTIDFGR